MSELTRRSMLQSLAAVAGASAVVAQSDTSEATAVDSLKYFPMNRAVLVVSLPAGATPTDDDLQAIREMASKTTSAIQRGETPWVVLPEGMNVRWERL